jgi:hypothetical protein
MPSRQRRISLAQVRRGSERIRILLSRATTSEMVEAGQWYNNWRLQCEELADALSCSVATACAMTAVLSAGVSFNVLKKWAQARFVGAPGSERQRRQLDALYRGGSPLGVLRGLKVRAFYLSTVFPEHKTDWGICVDRHVARAVLPEPRWADTLHKLPRATTKLAQASIARFADEYLPSWSYPSVQALVWIVQRRLVPRWSSPRRRGRRHKE